MTIQRILPFLSLLLTCAGVFSQTSSENYILTRTFTSADSSAWRDRVVYYDGLGREEQAVLVGASPSGGDIVTLKEYDGYGRLEKTWNGAAVSGNAGGHVDIGTLKALAVQSNGNDSKPYTLTVYEPSLLERPLRQYGAGSDWHQHDRYVGTAYHTNVSGDGRLDCIRFTATQAAGTAGITVANNGSTPTGSLTVVCTTGEDRDTTYEFRDLNNEVFLSRRILDGRCLDTYYIRDEWGNLLAVLPPMAAGQMTADNGSWSSTGSDILEQYAYLYCYDYRYRQIAKRLPGCDWQYTVYDTNDTPVFTQDGNQRQRGEWSYVLSDKWGRPCQTGTCTNSISVLSNPLTSPVVATRTTAGYSVSGTSLTSPVLLTETFYDRYSNIPGVTLGYDSGSGYGEKDAADPVGQVTATRTRLLDDSGTFLTGVKYYDYRGNVVQSKSDNHLGGVETEYASFDFTGNATARKHMHTASGKPTRTEQYTYAYDAWGRMTERRHKTGTGSWMTLSDLGYDALGRLASDGHNGHSNLQTSYGYNVRSWLSTVTNSTYSQQLYYNSTPGGSGKRYGGSIAVMDWMFGNSTFRYAFTYDGLGRLFSSHYSSGWGMDDYFSTMYNYDKNGNITRVLRNAMMTYGAEGLLDDLELHYDGNQVIRIIQYSDPDDFIDYYQYGDPNSTSVLCSYDRNGNMTKNMLKNILSVQYNLLNLPRRITYADGSFAEYLYTATGEKRQVSYQTAAATLEQPVASVLQQESQGPAITTMVPTVVDYCGPVIYKDGSLSRLLLEDTGYWLPGGFYQFFIKDHLGSTRAVIDQAGACSQTSQYYPYGKLWDDLWDINTQPNRYNGKELDRMHGLDCYDYGARMYDPGIGRFMTIDPKAEDYYDTSPYAYCLNNPIKNTDPDGRSVWSRGAKLLWHVGKAVAKNGLKALNTVDTYTSAFSDIQESVNTLTDANASTADKVMAGVSLASEFAPVSVGDAKEIGGVVKSALHGNSKASTKAQHAYDIINTETGKVVKTGVSGGAIRKDGKSVRAESQVRKWNKEAGKDIYRSEITHQEPAGEGARVRILEYEKDRANMLKDQLDPEKHKRP